MFDAETAVLPLAGLRSAAEDPGVAGVTGGFYAQQPIAGRQVSGFALDRLAGDVYPTLIEGRAADAPDEIVLGSKTMERAEVALGGEVEVEIDGEPRMMSVVGRAVFPPLTFGQLEPPGLGEGFATTSDALTGQDPSSLDGYNFALVRFAPGSALDAEHRVVSALQRVDGCPQGPGCGLTRDDKPGEIANAARVRATPVVLGCLLASLALATVAHVLVTSVRRRRRDLAVLKTLGFLGRQVSWTVAWQATTLATVAVVAGVPLGIAAGRWVWMLLADQLGVEPDASAPLGVAALVITATLIAANLIAALPARAAARTQPAIVLRSE
jgi:hypothetical protein